MSKASSPAVASDGVVENRVKREPAFAADLLQEAAQCMLSGELAAARNLVRNVIRGTIGYEKLSRLTGTPEKSLVRMFGPNGNPTAANISSVFVHLQRAGGVQLRVSSVPAPRKRSVRRPAAAVG